MKVDIVSGIGFRNSNINFGESKRAHEVAPVSKPSGVSDLAKVPVIVLLAMNPATLNSAIPTMPETDNPNKITILAPETKSSDAATYVISPEVDELQQANKGIIVPSGNALKIQDFEYLGHKYKVVYASDDKRINHRISNIYFYKDDQKINPSYMVALVHHNDVSTGKNFYGAIIHKDIIKDYKQKGAIESEVILPKFVSDYILKVINDETEFSHNLATVSFYKSNNSSIIPSKVIKYD